MRRGYEDEASMDNEGMNDKYTEGMESRRTGHMVDFVTITGLSGVGAFGRWRFCT
jgi:hypothetical protein